MNTLWLSFLMITVLFSVGVFNYYPDHPLQHFYFYGLMLYSASLGCSGAEKEISELNDSDNQS